MSQNEPHRPVKPGHKENRPFCVTTFSRVVQCVCALQRANVPSCHYDFKFLGYRDGGVKSVIFIYIL